MKVGFEILKGLGLRHRGAYRELRTWEAKDVLVLDLRAVRDSAVMGTLRNKPEEPGEPPVGAQLKVNFLLDRLPRLKSGVDPEVAFAGPFTGFGHLIIVQHAPQTFSLYGHLTSGSVAKGDRVTPGQPIGRAGRPPGARDSRLYFELRVDGQPVNPLQWLRQP